MTQLTHEIHTCELKTWSGRLQTYPSKTTKFKQEVPAYKWSNWSGCFQTFPSKITRVKQEVQTCEWNKDWLSELRIPPSIDLIQTALQNYRGSFYSLVRSFTMVIDYQNAHPTGNVTTIMIILTTDITSSTVFLVWSLSLTLNAGFCVAGCWCYCCPCIFLPAVGTKE